MVDDKGYGSNSNGRGGLTDFEVGYMKGCLEVATRDLEGLDEEIEAIKRVTAVDMRLEFTV